MIYYRSRFIPFIIIAYFAFNAVVCSQVNAEPNKYSLDTKILHPNPLPLISCGVPVYSDKGIASKANDDDYKSTWTSYTSGWIAYDLSNVEPQKRKSIDVVWYNNDTVDYDFTMGYYYHSGLAEKLNSPKSYTIEGNSAQGGSNVPKDGWKALVTVADNKYRSRQHVIDFKGYNWLRMNVTEVNGKSININLDIHDASKGLEDSWIFFGDSITNGCMKQTDDRTYSQIINARMPKYFPVVENGGVSGSFSSNGIDNIINWLSIFPGKYVCIAYGTNDAWGKQIGEENYYNFIKGMVKAVLNAGKIPVIPKIPWAKLPDVRDNVPRYNEKIEKLYEEYPQIIKGPDLWKFFYENQYYISDEPDDFVHPTVEGYNAMRQAWADTMLDRVYADSFGDMTNHWAKETVEYMAERNYIKGRNKNEFCPDDSITRAEFAALVVSTLKINKESSINAFKDVPDGAWFRSPVNKAYGAKVIAGVGNERFNPNDKITREQMVVMLMNAYYRVMKQSSDGIENIKDSAFNDEKGISDWAKLSVKIACNKGICKGFPDGTFRPQQSTTRAQAAVAMKLLLKAAKVN